jgi:two-component sensor histidine kinase
MTTASAGSSAVLASADHRETAFYRKALPPATKSSRPMNGLLALSERPAGVMVVTTLSAVLSRVSGSIQVGFGHYLQGLCDDLAETFSRSSGPELTCSIADAALPIGTAVTLKLIADLLITNAFVHAFSPGLPGRIDVSFTAGPEAWQLTVEDSGIALQAHGDQRENGLIIARLLVLRLGGRLSILEASRGTRCIVTVPLAAARA